MEVLVVGIVAYTCGLIFGWLLCAYVNQRHIDLGKAYEVWNQDH
jgi:hypothetical protein